MAFILIAEDDEALGILLQYNLRIGGYDVEVCVRGDDAERRLGEVTPDLLVLDWGLPGVTGVELCARVRARLGLERLPIIMLTALSEQSQKIQGLAAGADDFVVKPFSVPELQARIQALLRRSGPMSTRRVLVDGDIELDREMHRVRRAGREISMGPTEFKLLEHFLRSPGRVFSRQQLLDGVWGSGIHIDLRTVDVHIGRLRKAINRGRKRDPLRTVRGLGYALGGSVDPAAGRVSPSFDDGVMPSRPPESQSAAG